MEHTPNQKVLSRPNIFVLGVTRSAKTFIAEEIALATGRTVISGSSWVKEELSHLPLIEDKHEAIQHMTNYSTKRLKEDPEVALRFMRKALDPLGHNVIEGLRNPLDFIGLFRPAKDLVLFVQRIPAPGKPAVGPATAFEATGLQAIADILQFYQVLDDTISSRIHNAVWYSKDSCETPEVILERYIFPWLENAGIPT